MRHPGDDAQSAWNRGPEILAAEQHILTYADALLTWMRTADLGTLMQDPKIVRFFTHEGGNPFTEPVSVTRQMVLELLDPDANRFFAELLRAAWERRCWRAHYGEITPQERDAT